MTTVVGTASAVVGLIDTTINLIQAIRKARDNVKRTSKTLDSLSTQLETISTSLRLIQQEPRLQDSRIEEQVIVIHLIIEELKSFFDKLQAKQQKPQVTQLAHALRYGDKEDKELENILSRQDGAKIELLFRLSLVHIGLSGNINDGFEVAQREVVEMNEEMKRMLGVQLAIAQRLEARQLTTSGREIIRLDDSDIQALRLDLHAPSGDPKVSSKPVNDVSQKRNDNLKWRKNKTGDDPKFVVGNIGIEEQGETTVVRATVEDSEFGKNLRMVVGNIGKSGAPGFNESFW